MELLKRFCKLQLLFQFLIFGFAGATPCLNVSPDEFAPCAREHSLKIFDSLHYPTIHDLSEGRFESFTPANTSSDKGMMHSEMHRVFRDERSFLIKTVLPGSYAYGPVERFQRELFSMVLMSGIGGPEISRAGHIVGENGLSGYFLEMEELYPKQKNSFTLKGIYTFKNLLFQKMGVDLVSDSQLRSVAQLMRLSLERNIVLGRDIDLIFSKESDDSYWIDTTDFDIYSDSADWFRSGRRDKLVNMSDLDGFEGAASLHSYTRLIVSFGDLRIRYQKVLLNAFKNEILKSRVWSREQKKRLLENLRRGLLMDWQVVDDKSSCELFLLHSLL